MEQSETFMNAMAFHWTTQLDKVLRETFKGTREEGGRVVQEEYQPFSTKLEVVENGDEMTPYRVMISYVVKHSEAQMDEDGMISSLSTPCFLHGARTIPVDRDWNLCLEGMEFTSNLVPADARHEHLQDPPGHDPFAEN